MVLRVVVVSQLVHLPQEPVKNYFEDDDHELHAEASHHGPHQGDDRNH